MKKIVNMQKQLDMDVTLSNSGYYHCRRLRCFNLNTIYPLHLGKVCKLYVTLGKILCTL